MVFVVPVPVVVVPPGDCVSVQVPAEGKPFSTTLPVAILHVGCVIVPTTGAGGDAGAAIITTFPEGWEIHPEELVTVNEYVPGLIPVTVCTVPEPVIVIPPGFLVSVHVPVDGSPDNITEPDGTLHEG